MAELSKDLITNEQKKLKAIQDGINNLRSTEHNIEVLKELINDFKTIWKTDGGNLIREKFDNLVNDLESTIPPTDSISRLKSMKVTVLYSKVAVSKHVEHRIPE